MRQQKLFKSHPTYYGGTLLRTRKGRSHARPIATRRSMHIVLKSSLAVGDWSMNRPIHKRRIQETLHKMADQFATKVHSLAVVGNHLHLNVLFQRHRRDYFGFVRAFSAAVMMLVTGVSRWQKVERLKQRKFWDYRPYTRVLSGSKDFIGVQDYLQINQMEGDRIPRDFAIQVTRRLREWQVELSRLIRKIDT
jgi:REP element-mobilizing transposase RayT